MAEIPDIPGKERMISDAIRIYELLRWEHYYVASTPEALCTFVARHVQRDCYVTTRGQDGLTGVAFFWRINDPYDVQEVGGYPGEDRNGKYLFMPLIYIHRHHRGTPRLLQELIMLAFTKNPGARRLAFKRHPGRLHTSRKRGRPIKLGERDVDRIHVLNIIKSRPLVEA